MELQQFGFIETESGRAMAMLCRDIDRPKEIMLHWWGAERPSGAVLAQIEQIPDGTYVLTPQNIYRANDIGAIWVPRLSDDEQRHVKGFRAVLRLVDGYFEGEWSHVSGKSGRVHFGSDTPRRTVQAQTCSTWEEFKQWASDVREKDEAIMYRGHGTKRFRLGTTLARVGRYRLERYCWDTLHQFKGNAEAVSGIHFDMTNGDDYSTILGLAQHHGLPTPLLDWTNSPYIAAFFAFADAVESKSTRKDDTHVRIYGVTREFITRWSRPSVTVPYMMPYISPLSVSGRLNPRLYAQQGQFLVTNIGDVEHWLCDIGQKEGKTFLIAADVPIDCASEALADLQFMGLSAATMFPGLDGVCRMMKHEMLFRRGPSLVPGKPYNQALNTDKGSEDAGNEQP